MLLDSWPTYSDVIPNLISFGSYTFINIFLPEDMREFFNFLDIIVSKFIGFSMKKLYSFQLTNLNIRYFTSMLNLILSLVSLDLFRSFMTMALKFLEVHYLINCLRNIVLIFISVILDNFTFILSCILLWMIFWMIYLDDRLYFYFTISVISVTT